MFVATMAFALRDADFTIRVTCKAWASSHHVTMRMRCDTNQSVRKRATCLLLCQAPYPAACHSACRNLCEPRSRPAC